MKSLVKEEQSVDVLVPAGMEDIVAAVQKVVKLVSQVRVQRLSVEQAVSLAPRGRGQQQTAERQVDLSLSPEDAVEVERLHHFERVQQETVEQSNLMKRPSRR